MRSRVRSTTPLGIFVCGVMACALLAGCTPVKRAAVPAKRSSEPYRVETEGEIPPLAPQDVRKEVDRQETYEDLPVVEEPVKAETVEPVTSAPAAPERPEGKAPPGSPEAVPKTMDGYRVQVFASASREAAESARQAAEVRVGAVAYVEYGDGMYKVRVGDCRTREEAEALLRKCREAGYADAWVAAGRILLGTKGAPR